MSAPYDSSITANEVGGLESAAAAPRSAARVPSLNGLRAIAALSVLVFHAASTTGWTRAGAGAGYLRHLDVGVSMFFVLSGYLLYRPIAVAHFTANAPPQLGRYLRRRVLRIIPAYWIALGITAFVLHKTTIATPYDALVFFGLLQIYSGDHIFGGLVQAWSLCTEVAFYAFLPVYGWYLGRRRRDVTAQLVREGVGLAILAAISVGFRLWLFAVDAHLGYPWLPSYLDVFALGMGLAVLSAHAAVTGRRGNVARILSGEPMLVWGSAATLYVVMANLGLPQGLVPITAGQYILRQTFASVIAALIVGAVAFSSDRPWLGERFLSSPPLRGLGLVSYGIFLWHLTWIEVVIDWDDHRFATSFGVVLVAAIVLTVGTAIASYALVERPALTLGEGRSTSREVV